QFIGFGPMLGGPSVCREVTFDNVAVVGKLNARGAVGNGDGRAGDAGGPAPRPRDCKPVPALEAPGTAEAEPGRNNGQPRARRQVDEARLDLSPRSLGAIRYQGNVFALRNPHQASQGFNPSSPRRAGYLLDVEMRKRRGQELAVRVAAKKHAHIRMRTEVDG